MFYEFEDNENYALGERQENTAAPCGQMRPAEQDFVYQQEMQENISVEVNNEEDLENPLQEIHESVEQKEQEEQVHVQQKEYERPSTSFASAGLHTIVTNKATEYFEGKIKTETNLQQTKKFLQHETAFLKLVEKCMEIAKSKCQSLRAESSNNKEKLKYYQSIILQLDENQKAMYKIREMDTQQKDIDKKLYNSYQEQFSKLDLELKKICSDHSQQMAKKEEKLNNLKTVLANKKQNFENVSNNLRTKYDTLRDEYEKKQKIVVDNENKLKNSAIHISQLNEKLENLTTVYDAKVENNRSLEMKINDVNFQIHDLELKDNKVLKTEIENMEKCLRDITNAADNTLNKIDAKKNIILQKNAAQENLAKEIDEGRILLREKEKLLENLKHNHVQLFESYAEKQQVALQKKYALQVDLHHTDAQLKNLQETLIEQDQRNKERYEIISKIKKELDDLKEENIKSRENVNQLVFEIDNEVLENESLYNKIVDTEIEIDNLKKQDENTTVNQKLQVKELQDNYQKLVNNFESEKDAVMSEFQIKLETLTEEVSSKKTKLNTELESKETELEEVTKRAESAQNDFQTLEGNFNNKKKMKSDLKNEYELKMKQKRNFQTTQLEGETSNRTKEQKINPAVKPTPTLKSLGKPSSSRNKESGLRKLSFDSNWSNNNNDNLEDFLQTIKDMSRNDVPSSIKKFRRFEPPERDT